MPTHKLNWIKKIQLKSSKHASNKMGQNLSRKTAAAKCIFYPTKLCRKIPKQFMHTEDEKLKLQFKYELIRSYIIRTKNHTVHRFVQE